jgi:hypothetical protein
LKHGAVGVVIYPAADDRPGHPDMIRYNGIWPRAEELDKTSGGFQISRNQYDMLKSLMKQGAVRVHGKIDATLGPGKLTLVHAYIRASPQSDAEILITAHLDHPKWSANDNASGSGAMMEAARVLQTLIAAKKLAPPKLTIHFMWVPEYFGTLAYVSNHPEARRCDTPHESPMYMGPFTSKKCIVANINMDMVGEDTVKTNSRFYFTLTPDSIDSSLLNAYMLDILQQTREADLYAQTGMHNYWLPEAIPYAQGSDHDVFIGLGIPATMLGHDPDWTHHTSEDKIDKTDATEFRRAGTLASVAAYSFGRSPDCEMRGHAIRIGELEKRLAVDLRPVPEGALMRRLRINHKLLGAELQKAEFFYRMAMIDAFRSLPEPEPAVPGPKGLSLLPLDASVFENVSPDDKKWLAEQEARFASDSEGLATKPNFALISFEAVNFMDGHRSTAEIADLLSAEYLLDIDQAWVDRLVGILEKQKLVAK